MLREHRHVELQPQAPGPEGRELVRGRVPLCIGLRVWRVGQIGLQCLYVCSECMMVMGVWRVMWLVSIPLKVPGCGA